MKTLLLSSALLLSIFAFGQNKKENKSNNLNHTKMENTTENSKIQKSLDTYFESLNKSSVQQAVGQYAADGVFMPTGFPTATGTEQLTVSYENIFKAIQLNVTFKIEEIIYLGNDVAYVRTESNGSVTIHATGDKTAELNREFFLMKKEGGVWKIARYMFNQPK
ncbi:YybH family protein [Elizabethkingia meningoseptica]